MNESITEAAETNVLRASTCKPRMMYRIVFMVLLSITSSLKSLSKNGHYLHDISNNITFIIRNNRVRDMIQVIFNNENRD